MVVAMVDVWSILAQHDPVIDADQPMIMRRIH